jgi:hypothetical protein
MLEGVPRGGVFLARLLSQLRLREAHAGLTARVGAHRALAGNALVVLKALALSRAAVANTLVGALHVGVSVVGSDYVADPSQAPTNKKTMQHQHHS